MKTAAAYRNAALNSVFDTSADSGSIKVYAGAVPTHPEDSRSGNTLLVTVALGADAFAVASAGSKSANGLPISANPASAGTAAFADLCTSGGTVISQLTVGTSAADVIVPTVTVTMGIPWSVSSCAITMAE